MVMPGQVLGHGFFGVGFRGRLEFGASYEPLTGLEKRPATDPASYNLEYKLTSTPS